MIRLAATVLLALAVTGCANISLGSPVATLENIAAAREARIAPVALGRFALASGRPSGTDEKIVIRSNSIHSPFEGSLAGYLKEALAVDLRAAGLLDPASPIVVSGELMESAIDVPMGSAPAWSEVAAKFVVTRGSARVYEREFRARAEWTTKFMGVEEIPVAIGRYGLLHRKLVTDLLRDPRFREAARP
jgi:hypothetical protein